MLVTYGVGYTRRSVIQSPAGDEGLVLGLESFSPKPGNDFVKDAFGKTLL